MSVRSTIPLALLLCAACAPDESSEQLLAASGVRGPYGERGECGVERLERTFRVRVDERVSATLYFPLAPDATRLPGPPAVIVQGGLVESERYDWVGEHMATRCFVAIVPDHRSELSLLESQNSLGVLAAIERDEAFDGLIERPGVILGHSLGAVTASTIWLDRPQDFAALVMFAGVPLGGDDFSTRQPSQDDRIVSIASERDGRIDVPSVVEGITQMREGATPVYGFEIEGMNHMQWTTHITSEELEDDLEATISDDEALARGKFLIDLSTEHLIHPFAREDIERTEDLPPGVRVLAGEEAP